MQLCSSIMGQSIQSIIIERGWTLICQQWGTAYLEMVGEFYHAMGEDDVDALSYTLAVRGVSITFSTRIIAEFLDISHVGDTYPTMATLGPAVAPSDSDTLATSSTLVPNVALDGSSDGSEDEDLPDVGLTDDLVCQLGRDPSALNMMGGWSSDMLIV